MPSSAGTAFRPAGANSTIYLTGNTGATAAALLPNTPSVGSFQVRVRNKGTADLYIAFGPNANTTVTAPVSNGAAGALGVTASEIEVITVPASNTYVAITSSVTANVEITTGYGI